MLRAVPAVTQGAALGTEPGQLLLVLCLLLITLYVSRIVLHIAWRVVTVSLVFVSAAVIAMVFGLI